MKFSSLYSSLLALSVVFTACKKDSKDDAQPAAKSKTELLTTGIWRKTTDKTVCNGSTTDNFFSSDADNTYKFNADNSARFTFGAVHCSSTYPDADHNGTWILSSSNKFSLIDNVVGICGTQTIEEYDLAEITETRMLLRISGSYTDTTVLPHVVVTCESTITFAK